jgi:integrase
MRTKLTDASVARLRLPATGREPVWDTLLPAFGVMVSSTGSKVWIVAVRRPGKKHPVRLRVGGQFQAVNTTAARAAARALMAETPAAPAKLFRDLYPRFLAHGRTRKGRLIRPETLRLYRIVLESTAVPLHHRPVSEIRRSDIAELTHDVAVASGAPMAALARGALGRFWSWLEEIGAVDFNPVTKTPIYEVPPRTRVLRDTEIRLIWGIDETVTKYRSILRLLLLLGCRRAEIGQLRWSEIVEDILTLPGSRTKSGRPLQLPLPPLALAEIERQTRILGCDFVFGVRGFTDWSKAKKQFDREVPIATPWSPHDLRRTCRTRLHKLGVPHDTVVRILNHDVGKLADVYDQHDYLPQKRMALEQWSQELLRILGAPAPEVVRLGTSQC